MVEKDPEELRKVAEKRVPQQPKSKSVNDYFRNAVSYSSRSATPRDHKIPMIRVDLDMAERLADYGNTNNLAMSEAVRAALDLGLSTWEDGHGEDDGKS